MNKKLKQPEVYYYSPKQALVVYSTNPLQNDNKESKYYIEISDIMQDGKRSFIGAGKPVTKETLSGIMSIVADSDKQTFHSVTEIVPANLLLIDQRPGRNILAWWNTAKRKTLQMQNKKTVTVWMPPIVYIVNGDKLGVAALKSNRKPTIAARLYHAPFFNVYKDMHVCLGNVKPPKTDGNIPGLIAEWEKAFWNSEFTETVTGAYKKEDLIRWMRKSRRGKFDTKKLIQCGKNLKQLAESL